MQQRRKMKSHLSRKRKRSIRLPAASSQVSKIVGESLTNIESLPDELVFEILVHVPPQDIQNGARLVCRKWYRIINSPDFINANLHHSPPGLLIQYWCGKKHSVFVSMQQGQIEISELHYEFKHSNSSLGSCNGLVVDNNNNLVGGGDTSIYHVVNPTTGQRYALPRMSCERAADSSVVIAYAAASKEYKVVLTYSSDRVTSAQCCAILTVGVDRHWRRISTRHLSLPARKFFFSWPLIAGGFIHWTERQSGNRVLTLNVETEVFTSTPVPQGYEKRYNYFLTTGSSLTLLVACSNLSWEVWELKQEESGEWMKQFKIDLEAQKWRLEELVLEYIGSISPFILEPDSWLKNMIMEPVGWLNYGELLVLRASKTSRVCFLYNVRTQEIDSFELKHDFGFSSFRFHKNSLVHLVV